LNLSKPVTIMQCSNEITITIINMGWKFRGGWVPIYTVSQKNVPPLQLAIMFTYTVRLRQLLAQMLPRK